MSRLKKADVEVVYSDEEIKELSKCHNNYDYTICNYFHTKHPIRGDIKFELYDYQKDLLNSYINNRWSIVLCPRQQGKSETSCAYLLCEAMFKKNQTILICSNKLSSAVEMMTRILYMYSSLPFWMVPGIKSANKTSIEFDNGSRIVSRATTKDAGRSLSISILYVDEFAFVERHLAEEFWASIYPVISTGGKIIITSTPNGDNNQFYYIWRDSYELNEDTGFAAIRIYWEQHPDRDDEWARITKAALGDDAKWEQEYECSFLSNARTLIDIKRLNDMIKNAWTPINMTHRMAHDSWNVYETPTAGGEYFMMVDTGEGVGKDNHCINIFNEKLEQVAILANNLMDFEELAKEIKKASDYYNEAIIYIENESTAQAVTTLLARIHDINERLARERPGSPAGFKMTASRRNTGVAMLRQNVVSGRLKLRDKDNIKEIKFFKMALGSNKYKAESGCKDDRVMTLVLFSSLLDKIANNNDTVYDKLYGENEGENEIDVEERDEVFDDVPPAMPTSSFDKMIDEEFKWV